MTRFGLCALTMALAAGHCLAEPNTMDQAVHTFGEMEGPQDNTTDAPYDDGNVQLTTSSTSTTTRTVSGSTPDSPETWWKVFMKAVQQQFKLQDSMLRQLFKDVLKFLGSLRGPYNYDDSDSTPFTKVNEMMDMITNRMTTARENADELVASGVNLENEALQNITNKFMKEVRVQDVVVDALWASLRGVQISAFMSGATVAEDNDANATANHAAMEFLARMYHNLRAAGISENDVAKFVPKPNPQQGIRGRSMRGVGRWDGFYGSGYPQYRSSTYTWGYPGYGFGYGYPYPAYGGWGSPAYQWRRLAPNCPGCPPPMMPPQMFPPPFRPENEDPMGMGYNAPMMGMGFNPPVMNQGPNNPMRAQGNADSMMGQSPIAAMPPRGTTNTRDPGHTPTRPTGMTSGYPPFGDSTNTTGTNGPRRSVSETNRFNMPYGTTGDSFGGVRGLAPADALPGFFPEAGMPIPPVPGFGPAEELPF